MNRKRKFPAAAPALVLLGVVAAWLPASAEQAASAAAKQSTAPSEEETREYFTDLPLLTHEGETVRFYSDVLKDRVVLINFVYTNCTDYCPAVTQQLSQVRDRLGDQFDNPIRFVTISADPERDTPDALAKFAKQQKADESGWLFLTGEKENIDFITKRLGQFAPDVEAHSTLMIAGNVATRHWIKIVPRTPTPVITMKLQSLAAESSG